MVSENKCVSGYHLGYLLNNPSVAEELKTDINTLLDFFQQGKIKVKIDSTYSFSKIGEAMKRMHARLNIGKIILKPDSEVVETDQVNITTPTVEPVKESKSTPKDKKLERKESESKKSKNKSKVAEPEVKKPVVDESVVVAEVKPVVVAEVKPVVVETVTATEQTVTEKVEEPAAPVVVPPIVDDGAVPLTA